MTPVKLLLSIYKWRRMYSFLLNKIVKLEDGYAFSNTIREIYRDKHGIHIGYGSYGGCFNIGNIPSGSHFGNYCSIAQGVKIFRANHPADYFTMHPLFYNPSMGYVKKDMLERNDIYIGHDVWIGANTIITPSVTQIGNGVIIGAGSVVTKNSLSYTIIAGNPAKKIRMRFSQAVMDCLEESEWWLLRKEELIIFKEEFEKIINAK